QPSMTAPSAKPWDSPNVVTLKSAPKVLPDMRLPPALSLPPRSRIFRHRGGDLRGNARGGFPRRVDGQIGQGTVNRQALRQHPLDFFQRAGPGQRGPLRAVLLLAPDPERQGPRVGPQPHEFPPL